jgi:aminopeptidase-like protein
VVSYSRPVRTRLALDELKAHLFTLPDQADRIPYRTSYYSENWGFCLSDAQLRALPPGEYDVCIDASLAPGSLTYGECYLPGETSEEVLISTHVCHPSLCNDNLSGISLSVALAERLGRLRPRYSYRFIFVPGTIGSITWLSRNEPRLPRIKHGLVLTGVGDRGRVTYKKSRRGDADIDRAMAHVLRHSGHDHEIVDFTPYGYDERQFCSPGFNLPVGCFSRSMYGRYPEYHTSADDLTFVEPAMLGDSFAKVLSALYVLEHDRAFVNRNPKCEPQLGKRGIYRAVGGQSKEQIDELAMLWVLNLSDGTRSLLDVANRSGLSFATIKAAADLLKAHDLLEERAPGEAGDGRTVPSRTIRDSAGDPA